MLFQPGEDLLWAYYGVRSSLIAHGHLTEILRRLSTACAWLTSAYHLIPVSALARKEGRIIRRTFDAVAPACRWLFSRSEPDRSQRRGWRMRC
jgi:hypothetical protein